MAKRVEIYVPVICQVEVNKDGSYRVLSAAVDTNEYFPSDRCWYPDKELWSDGCEFYSEEDGSYKPDNPVNAADRIIADALMTQEFPGEEVES